MNFRALNNRIFPSKLLLFGEHTVNSGSQALAMPLNLYRGYWTLDKSEVHASTPYLQALLHYLTILQKEEKLLVDYDLAGFRQMLSKGLAFESNIPIGYGLGSSGALCAAVYDAFCLKKVGENLSLLKKQLGQLESYFHGSSSGIDPLVSYLQQEIYIESKEHIRTTTIPDSGSGKGGIFLLNTKIERRTEPFVKIYLDKCEDEYFARKCATELVVYNDAAIYALLQSDWESLLELVHKISVFQYRYLEEMIPFEFHQIWLDGLAETDYKLKLCGAGGGGFILGFCRDFTKVEKQIKEWELVKVFSFQAFIHSFLQLIF